MHPPCKILNTPVMSICLIKQNDGTWVENINVFLFNVYKRFFVTFFTFFYVFYFFPERFFTSMILTGSHQGRIFRRFSTRTLLLFDLQRPNSA